MTHDHADNPTTPPSARAQPATQQHQYVPLIVMAGWRSGWFMPALLARRIRTHTGRDRNSVISVAFPTCGSIPLAARRLVETIDKHWPSNNPDYTTQVDIAAVSMAGLASRYAALPPHTRAQLDQLQTTPAGSNSTQPSTTTIRQAAANEQGNEQAQARHRTLHIRNLFTIATPHRGARLAKYIAPDAAAKSMRPGCPFLDALDQSNPANPYKLTCYARTRDWWVGHNNTAPPDTTPIIYKAPLFTFSHLCVSMDKRIAADIAEKLAVETTIR